MESPSRDLTRIRIQTARMMEIYALLQQEMAENPDTSFRPQDIERLHQAIVTLERNMRQLQGCFVRSGESPSPLHAEANELEGLLKTVLSWARQER